MGRGGGPGLPGNKNIMKVGDKISISEFHFTNKSGGTGDSQPFSRPLEGYEYYQEDIDIVITKIWEDYETGIKGWGMPDKKNKRLMEFLKRNCKEGYYIFHTGKGYLESEWVDEPGTYVIYWSEWDIV